MVTFGHSGDLPKHCSKGKAHPAEMFMVKVLKEKNMFWLEVYCNDCFREELDKLIGESIKEYYKVGDVECLANV